jgi:hypothetical protein
MIAKLSPAALLIALAVSCAALPVQAAVETAKTRAEADRLSRIAANAKVRQVLVVRSGRQGGRRVAVIRSEPAKPSFGQMIGLHESADSLELKSGVALILDQDTNEVLFSKNSEAVLPIASLTAHARWSLPKRSSRSTNRHDHRRGYRQEGQPLPPARWHPAAPRGHAAPGADVVGEPGRQCARAQLSGAAGRVVAAMNHKARAWA